MVNGSFTWAGEVELVVAIRWPVADRRPSKNTWHISSVFLLAAGNSTSDSSGCAHRQQPNKDIPKLKTQQKPPGNRHLALSPLVTPKGLQNIPSITIKATRSCPTLDDYSSNAAEKAKASLRLKSCFIHSKKNKNSSHVQVTRESLWRFGCMVG